VDFSNEILYNKSMTERHERLFIDDPNLRYRLVIGDLVVSLTAACADDPFVSAREVFSRVINDNSIRLVGRLAFADSTGDPELDGEIISEASAIVAQTESKMRGEWLFDDPIGVDAASLAICSIEAFYNQQNRSQLEQGLVDFHRVKWPSYPQFGPLEQALSNACQYTFPPGAGTRAVDENQLPNRIKIEQPDSRFMPAAASFASGDEYGAPTITVPSITLDTGGAVKTKRHGAVLGDINSETFLPILWRNDLIFHPEDIGCGDYYRENAEKTFGSASFVAVMRYYDLLAAVELGDYSRAIAIINEQKNKPSP
jgi:hypothetical protein